MDAAVTSTGKLCKLCKAKLKEKGDRCHLHGGAKTPREYSKHWKALYEKERKEYIDAWKSQNEPGIWFTPLQKDIPYITFKEWLKGKEGVQTPPKHPPKTSPKHSPGRKSPKNKDVKPISDLDDLFGTFDTLGVRKSPPKTPPAEFHYLENLPLPALQQILLNMPPGELFRVFSIPNVRKIIRENNFRRLYAKKHKKKPIFGHLSGNAEGYGLYQFRDSKGAEMELGLDSIKIKFLVSNNVVVTVLILSGKSNYWRPPEDRKLKVWINAEHSVADDSDDDLSYELEESESRAKIKELFENIKRPEFSNLSNVDIGRSILLDLKNAMKRSDIPKKESRIKIITSLLEEK